MKPQKSYRRTPFENRPWIKNRAWDLMSGDSILHVDVFARVLAGRYWLVFDVRAGGKVRRALDIFEITEGNWRSGALPVEARHVHWGYSNRHHFEGVHMIALRQAASYLRAPYSRVEPLFHYVKVDDREPLRGINNHWRYGDQSAQQY